MIVEINSLDWLKWVGCPSLVAGEVGDDDDGGGGDRFLPVLDCVLVVVAKLVMKA